MTNKIESLEQRALLDGSGGWSDTLSYVAKGAACSGTFFLVGFLPVAVFGKHVAHKAAYNSMAPELGSAKRYTTAENGASHHAVLAGLGVGVVGMFLTEGNCWPR